MWVLVSKYKQNKKKIEICTQKKVGNLPNLIISSQDGQVARHVTSLSWAQLMLEIKHHKPMIAHLSCLSRSVDPLVDWQQLQHCCEELSVLEREEERYWLVAALWKSRLRLHPGWTLQEPDWDPEISWPGPPPNSGPYRTTNKLKLCHISNFLLAPLYLLNLLKQCADCCVWFSHFYQAAHNGIKVSNRVHNMIYTKDLRCAIHRLI